MCLNHKFHILGQTLVKYKKNLIIIFWKTDIKKKSKNKTKKEKKLF